MSTSRQSPNKIPRSWNGRPKISPPYFPTKPHKKMSSASSIASDSSSSSITSYSSSHNDLDQRACDILNLLWNKRDFKSASQLIHPLVAVQHDDDIPQVSREALVARWRNLATRHPQSHMEIHEAVLDETQRKVWVRGEIRGLSEGYKEKIYMMTFDDAGLLIKSDDYYRKRRSV